MQNNGFGQYGMIQIFTGDGKGKTTAALGEVLRCIGVEKKAAVVFFDKGGDHYSERASLERLGVEWWAFGRDRINTRTGKFDFLISDEDREFGREGIKETRELF